MTMVFLSRTFHEDEGIEEVILIANYLTAFNSIRLAANPYGVLRQFPDHFIQVIVPMPTFDENKKSIARGKYDIGMA